MRAWKDLLHPLAFLALSRGARKPLNAAFRLVVEEYGSGFGGEQFTDAADHAALGLVEREELKTVAQTLAVTHNGSHSQGVGTEGQRNIEGDDFAGFQVASESGADAVLPKFSGASPTTAEFAGLKHADLHAGIDGKTRETSNISRRRLVGREFFARGCHVSNPVASETALTSCDITDLCWYFLDACLESPAKCQWSVKFRSYWPMATGH